MQQELAAEKGVTHTEIFGCVWHINDRENNKMSSLANDFATISSTHRGIFLTLSQAVSEKSHYICVKKFLTD